MKILPTDTPLQPVPTRTPSGHISRRWLPLARGAWVVCALLVLANFVASIPAYFQIMQTVCTVELCNRANYGQHRPDPYLPTSNPEKLGCLLCHSGSRDIPSALGPRTADLLAQVR
jgi:hypothetical protein